jgi:hypothetical protein
LQGRIACCRSPLHSRRRLALPRSRRITAHAATTAPAPPRSRGHSDVPDDVMRRAIGIGAREIASPRRTASGGRGMMTARPIIRICLPARSWRIQAAPRATDASERDPPSTVPAVSATPAVPTESRGMNRQAKSTASAREERLPRRLRARLLKRGPYRPRTDDPEDAPS